MSDFALSGVKCVITFDKSQRSIGIGISYFTQNEVSGAN